MKVAILKYNAGNIQSVSFALNRLGVSPTITDDPQILTAADRVIFPGVGEAASAMQYLKERNLNQVIKSLQCPVLGICLGMQLMCESSEEGFTSGLGIFPVKVKRFPAADKVPQVGWNTIAQLRGPLFKNIPAESYFYFVHSYYAELSADSAAVCDYIVEFSASLAKDNFYGTQFHPEKSGSSGELVLKNFLEL